jgi:hypothetical protein
MVSDIVIERKLGLATLTPSKQSFSEIVRSLEFRDDTSIGSLVDTFGERAFGVLMLIFAMPGILPAPPGVSAIFALPLVLLTFQMLIGRRCMWLPASFRRRNISKSRIDRLLTRSLPVINWLERVLHPRLPLLVGSEYAWRGIGLVGFPLAVMVLLPIPFANSLPSAAIALIAAGLVEEDGLAVLLGWFFAILTIVTLVAFWSTIYIAAVELYRHFSLTPEPALIEHQQGRVTDCGNLGSPS